MAVESTDALLSSSGKIAEGPTSLWIWCAWNWTRVSWSLEDIAQESARIGLTGFLNECGVEAEIIVDFDGPWLLLQRRRKPDANFRTLGLREDDVSGDWTLAACCRHSSSEFSLNSHDFACVERSKSISSLGSMFCFEGRLVVGKVTLQNCWYWRHHLL